MNQLSPAEKREFLKSMEVEWQTLLKNHAARVLSLEETAQARARWLDRANGHSLGTYLEARRKQAIRAPCEGTKNHLRFFTDPDLLHIESHSPTLTRKGFMTVLPWTQVTFRGRAASVLTLGT